MRIWNKPPQSTGNPRQNYNVSWTVDTWIWESPNTMKPMWRFILRHSSQSHTRVWDRCSGRRIFREREDGTKMMEQDQAEAWNKHTSKQTQGSLPRVNLPWLATDHGRKPLHLQPRRLLQLKARKLAGTLRQYTGAMQVAVTLCSKRKGGKAHMRTQENTGSRP